MRRALAIAAVALLAAPFLAEASPPIVPAQPAAPDKAKGKPAAKVQAPKAEAKPAAKAESPKADAGKSDEGDKSAKTKPSKKSSKKTEQKPA
jgi:hypothetical protein